GTIRVVSLPSLREESKLVMIRAMHSLGLSKSGLVVASMDLGEVLLLDPQSLELRKRIKVGFPGSGETYRVLSSPSTNRMFLCTEKDNLIQVELPGGELKKISLTGLLTRQGGKQKRHASSRIPSSWERAQLTPDGVFIICSQGWGASRFRVDGGEFLL